MTKPEDSNSTFVPRVPEDFDFLKYFLFEQNIAYWIDKLPETLSFEEMVGIRNKAFEYHLDSCDIDIRESWNNGNHLSFDWENASEASLLARELEELVKPLGYEGKVGLGYYHGNSLVLYLDNQEQIKTMPKVPLFYKGFMMK